MQNSGWVQRYATTPLSKNGIISEPAGCYKPEGGHKDGYKIKTSIIIEEAEEEINLNYRDVTQFQ